MRAVFQYFFADFQSIRANFYSFEHWAVRKSFFADGKKAVRTLKMHNRGAFERSVSDADDGLRKNDFFYILIVSEGGFSDFFDCQNPFYIRFVQLVCDLRLNTAWNFNLFVRTQISLNRRRGFKNIVFEVAVNFESELLVGDARTLVDVRSEQAVDAGTEVYRMRSLEKD